MDCLELSLVRLTELQRTRIVNQQILVDGGFDCVRPLLVRLQLLHNRAVLDALRAELVKLELALVVDRHHLHGADVID